MDNCYSCKQRLEGLKDQHRCRPSQCQECLSSLLVVLMYLGLGSGVHHVPCIVALAGALKDEEERRRVWSAAEGASPSAGSVHPIAQLLVRCGWTIPRCVVERFVTNNAAELGTAFDARARSRTYSPSSPACRAPGCRSAPAAVWRRSSSCGWAKASDVGSTSF